VEVQAPPEVFYAIYVLIAAFFLYQARQLVESVRGCCGCCGRRRTPESPWVRLTLGVSDQVQEARHVEAVTTSWSDWNRLGRNIRANLVPNTWQEWNALSSHIRRHPWHLLRQAQRRRQ
jgi:hypothetical protein